MSSREHLAAMLEADRELYEKCLDTPGFSYHLNQLALLAENAHAECRAEIQRLEKLVEHWKAAYLHLWESVNGPLTLPSEQTDEQQFPSGKRHFQKCRLGTDEVQCNKTDDGSRERRQRLVDAREAWDMNTRDEQ